MGRDEWASARNVLCIRLDTVGDVLMTTPAIRALKESGSARRITLLTSSPGAQVACLVPEIDRVMSYKAPWMKATAEQQDSRAEYAMLDLLREQAFDAAVIFTVYSQSPLPSAMLAYLAGIPLRLAHCRENPYQLLTDWVPESEPDKQVRHEVRRQLDLVAAVGCQTSDEHLSLRIPDDALAALPARLAEAGVTNDRPWILIHPGATAASRRYSPEGFAAVARRLVLDNGLGVLFTGSEQERLLIEDIQVSAGVPTQSVAGRLDLGELAALIGQAPLLIANNTGPVHIAAALGTPVVDLYALTNPQHTPWLVPHRLLYHDVPCKFCYKSICPQGHHNCLRLVRPDDVVTAALSLLAEAGHSVCAVSRPKRARRNAAERVPALSLPSDDGLRGGVAATAVGRAKS